MFNFCMGALTMIILIIVILAIIGLGWQVFVSGVFKGAERIINTNPVLKNTTQEAKQYFGGIIKNVSEGIIGSDSKVRSTQ
jgi:Tfp pilus assembly protein PilO